jgi:hypothetical protein
MRTRKLASVHALGLALLLLCSAPVAAEEVTWNYSGQITSTNFPVEFPLGAPVRLSVTVDTDLQTVVSATATFNGFAYEMGPGIIAYFGLINGSHSYYSSGLATGPTVGSFTPWFSTLFFRGESGPPLTADPLSWAQSFVFEDGFGASIGAADLIPDPPPTPQELLVELRDQVNALDVHPGIATGLCAKVSAAIATLEDDNVENDEAARNVLAAFVSAVEAQRGKAVSDADASALVAAAAAIVAALGG